MAESKVDVQIQRRAGGAPVRTDRPQRHAVVIGGSLAGLLAAHVLTVYADKVTLVERDRLPKEAEHRAGLPQDHHTHVLLASGRRALDALLPGAVDEVIEAGAVPVGMPHDVVQHQGGRWYRRTAATADIVSVRRPLLDAVVRRRVLANRQIERVEHADVVGLLGTARRVTGVLVRDRDVEGQAGTPRRIEADLVVDASGRTTRAPEWLGAIGAEPPLQETVDAGLAYVTRTYRVPEGVRGTGSVSPADADYRGMYFVPHPDLPRGAVLMPLDDGRAIVTLSGLRGDEPPTDEDGFLDFAAGLAHPLLREWLAGAEPDGPIRGFRRTANERRRYDRPGRRPAAFLATGDALCTVNPIYGQGMAVAAMCAVALRDALAGLTRTPSTARVQQALFEATEQAWDIATGADKTMPGVVGRGPAGPADRVSAWYLGRVQRRAPGDPEVGAAFREVLQLSAAPASLLSPRIAKAVLWGSEPEAPSAPPLRPEAAAGRS